MYEDRIFKEKAKNEAIEEMSIKEKQRVKSGKKRRWLVPVFLVIGILIVVYTGGVAYATQRFLPNTSIRGLDVSGMSYEEANELLKDQGLVITVEQAGKNREGLVTETINLIDSADAHIEYDTEKTLATQNKIMWFNSFFTTTDFNDITGRGDIDLEKLKIAIDGLCSQQRNPETRSRNAYIKVNGNEVFIVPEVLGNAVERNVAIDKIVPVAEAMINGAGNQTIDLTGDCKDPEIKATDADLIAKRDVMEKLLGRTITINLTSSSAETLEGEDVAEFLDFSGKNPKVNEEKLSAYVTELADEFYINMYEYLIYDDLFEDLKTAILSDRDEVIQASWYINYPQPRTNGNGSPSFIEVSIANQYLWYYENGSLVLSTPVVTGQVGTWPTPTGYFMVTHKEENARLVGQDYDVRVSFWMGIDNVGYYGIHDATWRGAFGGDIYTYMGSHGCVSLPYWAAEALYERVNVNVTEVYIYN